MTQKELADAVGLAKNGDRTIRRWESGIGSPSKLELNQILLFPEDVPFGNKIDADYTMIDLFAGMKLINSLQKHIRLTMGKNLQEILH